MKLSRKSTQFINNCIKCFLVLLTAICCIINTVHAENAVVGGYVFPPFVEQENDEYRGLTIDFIKMLNAFQKRYSFTFVPTSSKRRYRDFEKGNFDIIFFENIQWGWKDKKIDASKVFLKGGEIYITKASPLKNQLYFNDLKGKSLIGYLGYHYGFAGFNSDENYLNANFNIKLTCSHERNIEIVLKERADIAVVTVSFLKRYLSDKPDIKNKILISSKLDQEYLHTILVRKNNSPDVHEINGLLDEVKKAGVLSDLFRRYGIDSYD